MHCTFFSCVFLSSMLSFSLVIKYILSPKHLPFFFVSFSGGILWYFPKASITVELKRHIINITHILSKNTKIHNMQRFFILWTNSTWFFSIFFSIYQSNVNLKMRPFHLGGEFLEWDINSRLFSWRERGINRSALPNTTSVLFQGKHDYQIYRFSDAENTIEKVCSSVSYKHVNLGFIKFRWNKTDILIMWTIMNLLLAYHCQKFLVL